MVFDPDRLRNSACDDACLVEQQQVVGATHPLHRDTLGGDFFRQFPDTDQFCQWPHRIAGTGRKAYRIPTPERAGEIPDAPVVSLIPDEPWVVGGHVRLLASRCDCSDRVFSGTLGRLETSHWSELNDHSAAQCDPRFPASLIFCFRKWRKGGDFAGSTGCSFRLVDEPLVGIEPTTYSLRVNCSTPELQWRGTRLSKQTAGNVAVPTAVSTSVE